MNDRFKFRCYNKFQEKMFEVKSISYIDGIVKRIEVQDEERILIFDEWQNNIDNTILMQCTGLKDKNCKLIYEGDIVKKTVFIDYQGDGQYQPDVYVDREYIGVVHFSASNGATLQKVKIFETGSPYEAKKQRDKRDCPKATKLIACRSEVIGNIYENKELLDEIHN